MPSNIKKPPKPLKKKTKTAMATPESKIKKDSLVAKRAREFEEKIAAANKAAKPAEKINHEKKIGPNIESLAKKLNNFTPRLPEPNEISKMDENRARIEKRTKKGKDSSLSNKSNEFLEKEKTQEEMIEDFKRNFRARPMTDNELRARGVYTKPKPKPRTWAEWFWQMAKYINDCIFGVRSPNKANKRQPVAKSEKKQNTPSEKITKPISVKIVKNKKNIFERGGLIF